MQVVTIYLVEWLLIVYILDQHIGQCVLTFLEVESLSLYLWYFPMTFVRFRVAAG